LVYNLNLSANIGSEWEVAKCVTFNTWGHPDSVLMARDGVDPPFLDAVPSSLVSWTAATVQFTQEVGAWSSDVAVVWRRDTLFAWIVIPALLLDYARSGDGGEEGNNEGSDWGHFDYLGVR